jgi:transcriptional regulator with XRE-family HTH domain
MNKDYQVLKREAVQLRKKGLSYNEIRKKIGVAKSTLSLWLKNIPLKPEHKKRLYTKQIEILSRGPNSQKERRAREVKAIIKESKKEIKLPLSFETKRLMGAALYWAEGSKGKMFEITNSDPYLILFIVKWIEEVFGISPRDLKARLNIYPQQSETKIKKFWSDLTRVPVSRFGKSYIKPPNKGYKKNNLYYGTIRIEMPKSADKLQRIFGWIQGAMKNITADVEVVQKKWQSLTKTPRPVNLKIK